MHDSVLERLTGQFCRYINVVAASDIILEFGNDPLNRNSPRTLLSIACAWRFEKDNLLKIGTEDLRQASTTEVDWPVLTTTSNELLTCPVISTSVGFPICDIVVHFKSGWCFRAFTDSEAGRSWTIDFPDSTVLRMDENGIIVCCDLPEG